MSCSHFLLYYALPRSVFLEVPYHHNVRNTPWFCSFLKRCQTENLAASHELQNWNLFEVNSVDFELRSHQSDVLQVYLRLRNINQSE